MLWVWLTLSHTAALGIGYFICDWNWRGRSASTHDIETVRSLLVENHRLHIAAIEERYGINANIPFGVRLNMPETEH